MAASTNHGAAAGCLATDPKVFTTETGRHHVLMTVMVDRDCRNVTTRERDSDAVTVEA